MYRVFRHVSYEACIEVSGPGGLSGYAGREEMALGATYVTVRASLGWAADAEETMDEILEVGDVCAGGPGYEAERWFAGGTAGCERVVGCPGRGHSLSSSLNVVSVGTPMRPSSSELSSSSGAKRRTDLWPVLEEDATLDAEGLVSGALTGDVGLDMVGGGGGVSASKCEWREIGDVLRAQPAMSDRRLD